MWNPPPRARGRLAAEIQDRIQIRLQDPGQRHDLASSRPEAVEALMGLLLGATRPVPQDMTTFEMDEQTRRQLESLGYIH